MTFADTGFLVSLYVTETTTAEARAIAATIRPPILLTAFTLTELHNAINLGVFRHRLTLPERDAYRNAIEGHLDAGYYELRPIDPAELHRLARALSDLHTPRLGTRTLDLLHVATARLLNAKTFLSFDQRQRAVARAEGMDVRPKS